MQGYSGIERSSSACVRFVRNSEIDGSEYEILREIRDRGIRFAYVDPNAVASEVRLANQIAGTLDLENAPYETKHWLCFLDDLITLAYRERGLVVVVDNAWALVDKRQDELFDLVEAFLTQFHHWFEQHKPCHLCFQMEPNAQLASWIATEFAGDKR